MFQETVSSGENDPIAIVVSKRIKPYMSILSGMTGEFEKMKKQYEVFVLLDSEMQNAQKISDLLKADRFDLYAAIGPEATTLVWDLESQQPKVFTAVLDPEGLLKTKHSQCGISLRIPVETQVREISKAFVNIKNIGLLFDARNNDWFYQAADTAAQQYGIRIIPLQVESRNQITEVLDQNWENIDCIWMIPDPTIISEKIVQHIIKLAIYQEKGVIGYNPFFIRSGAFFSFDFDYSTLGMQTARKIETYIETGLCQPEPPEFQILTNEKIIERIGFQIRE